MAKGKRKNLNNRNQDHSTSSELSTPTSASPEYPITREKQDLDLKSYLMMLIEDIKKHFNNSLKEIQENTAKELQVLKEKHEITTKEVMELKKILQDLKREVKTIKKTQSETMLKIETLGKKSGTIDASISNKIQEMEDILRCRRFHREHGGNNQRKCKMQKDPNSKHPGNPGHNEKTKPMDNRSR
jgi:chromosome segregation ATPase